MTLEDMTTSFIKVEEQNKIKTGAFAANPQPPGLCNDLSFQVQQRG
jgi:hypothetical protein